MAENDAELIPCPGGCNCFVPRVIVEAVIARREERLRADIAAPDAAQSNANNHDERMRLVKTFAYEHVRFNHDPNNTYLVTDVTDDCMLELEGLAGLFAPHLFQRCNAQAQPIATTPPDFTEHPLRLVGQAERNGDLFLLFDGELGQHVLHQRTDDAEQWAAFTECSVGSITAREIYEAARPRLDHAANSSTTTEFTEQVRQLVNEFLVDADTAELTKRIASFAAEAAEAALEQAAGKCSEQQIGLGEWKEMQARWKVMDKREVWNDAVTHCADVIAAIGDDSEHGNRD